VVGDWKIEISKFPIPNFKINFYVPKLFQNRMAQFDEE